MTRTKTRKRAGPARRRPPTRERDLIDDDGLDEVAAGIAARIWDQLWVDGINGLRKGNDVFQVVTLDGLPAKIVRDGVPKMEMRPLRDDDFVDIGTAIRALEDVLGNLYLDHPELGYADVHARKHKKAAGTRP